MNRVGTFIAIGVGCVALLGGGYLAYAEVYARPMAKARADLSRWRSRASGYERDMEAAGPVRARLSQVAATTLGTSEEEVAHRFRSLLHEMAASAGLSDITITEGRTSVEINPAASNRRLGFARDEQRTPDFQVMNGEVRGTGRLEQVAGLLELSERQVWIHRVSSFSVTPVGDARELFEVRVSVATLILPDMGPPAGVRQAVKPLEPGAEAAWASIVSKNVFRLPQPPPAQPVPRVEPTPVPVPQVPVGPPPQPYFAWRLAGVMQGARGASVVMVDDAASRSTSVVVGESVLDALLVSASGESAVFVIDGVEFEVRLGQSLADRRAIEPRSE